VCVLLSLFVCLFVGIKPEKLYSASCVGREVDPVVLFNFFLSLFSKTQPNFFFWLCRHTVSAASTAGTHTGVVQ